MKPLKNTVHSHTRTHPESPLDVNNSKKKREYQENKVLTGYLFRK